VGVGVVRFTLLKRQNRGILNHATINIDRLSNSLIFLPTITAPNSLIIDVSCDEGMGFFFAKPTTFKNPMFKYESIDYYAVDHTPSYLWESATRSISAALIVYLPTVLAGRDSWQKDETIRQAINVDGGVIQNSSILSFQKREPHYPHAHINPVENVASNN
jgi:alanine dehydrogenase